MRYLLVALLCALSYAQTEGFVANGEDVNGVEGVSVDNSGDGTSTAGSSSAVLPVMVPETSDSTSSSSSSESSSSIEGSGCMPDEIDRTDICQPQVCDAQRVWKQIPLDCNYGMTPCSCCNTCESRGIYLRGPTSDLQNNDGNVRTFLAESSAKLHPVRCIRLSSQWLQRDIVHMELQGTNQQLNEVSRVTSGSGFTVPSFPGPYSLVTGPSSGNVPSTNSGSFGPGGGVSSGGGATAPSGGQNPRSTAQPLDLIRPRMCAMLSRTKCYGMALGGETGKMMGAAVCGWSPMGSCGLTYIDEEGSEGDICAMKRTFWKCFGMANSGSSDRICVWNPIMRICVGGELDQEPEGIMPPGMPMINSLPQQYRGAASAIFDRFGGAKLKNTHTETPSAAHHDYRLYAVGLFFMVASFAVTLFIFNVHIQTQHRNKF